MQDDSFGVPRDYLYPEMPKSYKWNGAAKKTGGRTKADKIIGTAYAILQQTLGDLA